MTSSGIILQCGVNNFAAEREVRSGLGRKRRHAMQETCASLHSMMMCVLLFSSAASAKQRKK